MAGKTKRKEVKRFVFKKACYGVIITAERRRQAKPRDAVDCVECSAWPSLRQVPSCGASAGLVTLLRCYWWATRDDARPAVVRCAAKRMPAVKNVLKLPAVPPESRPDRTILARNANPKTGIGANEGRKTRVEQHESVTKM